MKGLVFSLKNKADGTQPDSVSFSILALLYSRCGDAILKQNIRLSWNLRLHLAY